MKTVYVKPDASIVIYEIDEPVMDDLLIPSWEIGEDEDLA